MSPEVIAEIIVASIAAVASIITAVIGYKANKQAKENHNDTRSLLDDNKKVKKGIQQSLRHDLKDIYDEWWDKIYIKKTHKFIPKEIVDEFRDMYNAYHELGQNGVMTDAMKWMEDHKEMPTPDKL